MPISPIAVGLGLAGIALAILLTLLGLRWIGNPDHAVETFHR